MTKNYRLLFLILFVHVSILDLFFVNKNGPVFLWYENSKLITLCTHLLIAFLAVLLAFLLNKLMLALKKNNIIIAKTVPVLTVLILISVIVVQLI